MEPIDVAFERFKAIVAEVSGYAETVITESDTRVKVIDRIFVEVLGWDRGELLTEDPAITGFADYNFRIDGRSRLIVEAKRDGLKFDLDGAKNATRGYKLNGPVFKQATLREGIEQAIRYCGTKNAELACLSNGRQWVIFRGNRLGDGKDTVEGMGFAFKEVEEVIQNFSAFYGLLSRDSVKTLEYRPRFQEAEGKPLRTTAVSRSLNRAGSARVVPASSLAVDMDRIMASFFQRLTGDQDPDMITSCFVETRESEAADARLARVSSDLVGRIREIDTTDSSYLTQLIDRAARAKRNEFIILVGTKGAGKTTFITRFFNHILNRDVSERCAVLRINMGDYSADPSSVIDWLQRKLVEAIERSVFGDGYPEFSDLEGMFFDEYNRLRRGPWSTLYNSDKERFKIDFGRRIEDIRDQRPHEYIEGLLRHVIGVRNKLPVMVFDNADHFAIDFQESVYQYARSLHERSLCLIILPITDQTSWQMSRQGALQSFEHVDLYLPTPPMDRIIQKRIDFIQSRIELERQRSEAKYFLERGIAFSLGDLSAFTRSLQAIFLQTDDVSEWIGNFANNDLRRALEIARLFVTSPHLKVDDLLRAFLVSSGRSLPRWRAAKALVCLKYDSYPVGQNPYVQNVFFLGDSVDATPLVSVRILQMLEDFADSNPDDHFADVEDVIEYCESMGLAGTFASSSVDALLRAGLVLNFDPTVTDFSSASRVEISLSGRQHLSWSLGYFEYVNAMADVTPIRSMAAFDGMRQAIRGGVYGRESKVIAFSEYLISEDSLTCNPPEHPSYEGQRRIVISLQRLIAEQRQRIDDGASDQGHF
ncbi:AAA family ATPase [Actinoplanes sp. HUAS TT8]|uniref:AAA family ATPase n=1 Tax=Actinoplanes sp. HUAS TT8 TaxID=3447453 RepID=UPI003F5233B1